MSGDQNALPENKYGGKTGALSIQRISGTARDITEISTDIPYLRPHPTYP